MASLTACSWMPVLLTAYLIQIPPTDAVSGQCTERCLNLTATELNYEGISKYRAKISCESHPGVTVWLPDGPVNRPTEINCSVDVDRIHLQAKTRPENCSIQIDDNYQEKPITKCILNETFASSTTSRTLTNSAETHDSSADVRQPADRQTDSTNFLPGVAQYVLLLLCFPAGVFTLYCIFKSKISSWGSTLICVKKDKKVVIRVEDHTDETSVV